MCVWGGVGFVPVNEPGNTFETDADVDYLDLYICTYTHTYYKQTNKHCVNVRVCVCVCVCTSKGSQ